MKIQTWSKNNIDNIKEGSTWIICSARRSGKTVFSKFLVCVENGLYDKSDKIIVMTNPVNIYNWDFLPAKNIISGYQPRMIEKILKHQNKQKEEGKKLKRITLILDDLMVQTTKAEGCSQYCPTLWKIFSTGRHYNITLILISQSISLIGLNYLRNTDYFCFFNFFIKSDKKKMIQILGNYADEQEIKTLIKPERYHIFILELSNSEYELDKKLFKFKVPEQFLSLKVIKKKDKRERL